MQIEWEDKKYDFEPAQDLTLSRLRMIKAWFPGTKENPGLVSYLRFINAYGEGDPDALACVMWIMKVKAGEPTAEPVNMDNFAAGKFWQSIGNAVQVEFERLLAEAEAVAKQDPLAVPLEVPSSQEIPEPAISTEIPTISEASTSASSPTSATSPGETSTIAAGSTSAST